MVVVVFLRHIALVVNEMVEGASLGCVGTRKEFEVKAFLGQLLSAGKAFPRGIQLQQDVVIAGQDAVDFPHHIDLLVGLFVVIAVSCRHAR